MLKNWYFEHENFCLAKIYFQSNVFHLNTKALNTNISMQYGQSVPQKKLISLWRLQPFHGHISGLDFDIMNALQEFAASPI